MNWRPQIIPFRRSWFKPGRVLIVADLIEWAKQTFQLLVYWLEIGRIMGIGKLMVIVASKLPVFAPFTSSLILTPLHRMALLNSVLQLRNPFWLFLQLIAHKTEVTPLSLSWLLEWVTTELRVILLNVRNFSIMNVTTKKCFSFSDWLNLKA